MAPNPPDLNDLIQQAWAQHYRDPSLLLALGLQIVQTAGEGTPGAAAGWLQVAWGRRFRGEAEDARLALRQAALLADQHALTGLQASCRDLEAMVLGLARRWPEALALLAHNRALPPEGRSPWERGSTHQRLAMALDALGRRDDALRERYALLASARETGDPAPVAHALGMLCGMHADLYNLEEADRLGEEGARLALQAGAFQAWAMAALNRMNALVAAGRGAEAAPLAEALMAQEAKLNQRAREQRCIVYADALCQAGKLQRAQALLDESVSLRHTGSESLLSWTTAQVLCWLAQGEPQRAIDTGRAWLADPQAGTDPASVPSEQLRLLQALGSACEQVGDLASALQMQRQAFKVHEALVGRSARARRLALEIEHQLDRERQDREQAQQRQHAAEAERHRLDGLNRALAEASQAKTRFLAAASHDLRQPVQALAMNMAALQVDGLPPPQAQLVERMAQSLAALGRMFDVLLDISRLDAGIVPVHPEPLALRPLLQRLVHEHADLAAARGLRLRLRLPPGLSAMTHSDPVLLERCLRNLLDNALKYTRQGGVLLAVRPARGTEGPGQGWQVQIVDTGIGMDAQVQARVFEEFYQADNAERDRARGLGLGGAIVQRLCRLLAHPLALRSRPGRGTRVSLWLPVLPEPATTAAGAAQPVEQPALCLAVIDDDADVRDSLQAVLERWGHRVLVGADAAALQQAWQAAGRPALHGALSDLRLRAGQDGVQAVAELRQCLGARLPALIITGDIAPDRLQRLHDSGLPWLPKPVMPMRLRSWLAGVAAASAGNPL